jgi:acyl-CoA synthetase (AMP-forming)/AMP-acid ligase II
VLVDAGLQLSIEQPPLLARWVDAHPADAVALVDARSGAHLTYGELRCRIDSRRHRLGLPHRAFVVLSGDPSVEWVITYLSLLDGGHVPLLAASHVDRQVSVWQPNASIGVDGDQVEVSRHHDRPIDLHPDLALLLSTSGSTGDPKLVRLSHANLASNAEVIADFLGLTQRDRAITALPLHYCYGLSVLHSHLAVGASLVTIAASVVDPCFERAVGEHDVTTLAGVPHTFDLMERAGPTRLLTPSLRVVTQAGGRMGPEAVRRWSSRLAEAGVDFFVMYGQTEATARIAYLSPRLAGEHPDAIGVAIPGGELWIDDAGELPAHLPSGAGELVYRGPNVMLGYAESERDLALGQTMTELRTGDIGRRDPVTGLFEIVGRRSRFVKPFGLRIDLDRVEASLAATYPGELAVTGDDERLRVVAPGRDGAAVAIAAAHLTSLPAATIEVFVDRAVPRTSTGKVDGPAVMSWPGGAPPTSRPQPVASSADRPAACVFAEVLGRQVITDADTFVSLGGDSLSYIECSLRLEHVLGSLPTDWHLLPVGQLRPQRRRRLASVDTTVVLRAVGILAVVSTHMRVWYVPGGAHLMLAVVGYNFARFLSPIPDAREPLRSGFRTVVRVAGPTLAWISGGMLLGAYGWSTLSLANNYLGPSHHDDDYWHFWFIEVFVHLTVAATLLLAIPAVRQMERRHGYRFALELLMISLVLRLDWPGIDPANLRFRTHGVAWCFVLGWLVQRSDTTARKLITSLVIVVSVVDFFDYVPREAFVTVGVLSMLWLPRLTLLRPIVRPLATLASASMWILITHFTVWPVLVEAVGRTPAFPITVLAGVVTAAVTGRLATASRRWSAGLRNALWRSASGSSIAEPTHSLVRMT